MKKLTKKNYGRKVSREELQRMAAEVDCAREARIAMIQQLIPLGLMAVEDELQGEILELVGPRYGRGGAIKRWGANPSSVFVGDQKLKINVPRLRDLARGQEVALKSHERLQSPGSVDEAAFRRVINGISYAVTKKYAATQNKFKVGDLERQLWKKLREKKMEMIEQLSLDLYAA